MKKSELVREKISNEFYKLICKQGYHKTSMRQLSEACGISKGHIGFYYGKKEDIMVSICKIQLSKAYKLISLCAEIPDDKLLKLLNYIIFVFYMVSKRKVIYRLVSDMSTNNEFLKWRTETFCKYLYEAYLERGVETDVDELSNLCTFFVYGTYGYIHEEYIRGNIINYCNSFSMFIRTLIMHLDPLESLDYINKALRIFETLEIEKLVSQLEIELG